MSVTDILPIVLRIAVISVVIYFLIAFGLILSQGHSSSVSGETIDFSGQTTGTRPEPAPLQTYQARDGATLGYRHYASGNADAPLVIFIHGSGWHGGAYDGLARSIAEKAGVEVALPDLRGHGPNPQTRGDIAHVGQFEEDIAVSQVQRPPHAPQFRRLGPAADPPPHRPFHAQHSGHHRAQRPDRDPVQFPH
jgi:hypothetical protein